MRFACGDMRDHIVSYQNDHRPSYWRRRALAAAPAQGPEVRWLKSRNSGCRAVHLALNHGRRERKFWMQRRSAKNRHSNARTPAETKIRELSGRKSPQKRAIRRRAG